MNDKGGISGKRLTLAEDSSKDDIPTKKICVGGVGGVLKSKLQDVMNERQATNGAAR